MTAGSSGALRIEAAAGRPTALVVTGEVDAGSAPLLRAAVDEALDGTGDVVLDLAGVTFFDSSGVAVVVGAHQRLRSTGRSLVLRRLSPTVRRVLEIAQLTGELTIE